MKIVSCEQGTPEWFHARLGVATASCFDKIITPKTGKPSAQQDAYVCQLIAEMAMGGPPEEVESYTSRAMQHGIDTEPEARRWYEFETDATVTRVGFITTDCGRFGCSPDGLVGDDGGLELKCPMAHTHVGYLLDGGLPDQYKAQVHGSLWITGRKWWDFVSYCHGLPAHRVRVERDDFTAQLGEALEVFWGKFDAAKLKIESLGGITRQPVAVAGAVDDSGEPIVW